MSRTTDRRRLLVGLGITGAAAMAHLARARPLQAATGVGPTGKTLNQIAEKIARTDQGLAQHRIPVTSLPSAPNAQYVISARGVYYLPENIIGQAGKHAILIEASDVELECEGYTFVGAPGALACIRSSGPQRCIAIYDAGFTSWPHTSIDLTSAAECLVAYCWFNLCDSTGDPTARGTCALGPGGVVYDSDVRGCHGAMVSVGPNGIVEEVTNMDGTGGCFFSVGPAVMEDNWAINNAGTGFTILSQGVLIDNRLVSVGGISVGAGSTVSENDIDGAPVAIAVNGESVTVEENYIVAGVSGTGGTGIEVAAGSTGTVVDSNKIHGCIPAIVIAGADRCLVVCNSATGAGGTPVYVIAPGNSFGPIADVTGVGDISAVTDNPWTNFIH